MCIDARKRCIELSRLLTRSHRCARENGRVFCDGLTVDPAALREAHLSLAGMRQDVFDQRRAQADIGGVPDKERCCMPKSLTR